MPPPTGGLMRYLLIIPLSIMLLISVPATALISALFFFLGVIAIMEGGKGDICLYKNRTKRS